MDKPEIPCTLHIMCWLTRTGGRYIPPAEGAAPVEISEEIPTVRISFHVSNEDFRLIDRIVTRAEAIADRIGRPLNVSQIMMDVTACHANGCPLQLEKLLKADEFTFVHDVFGIERHLDRATGKLTDAFSPRLADRSAS
jgi:hypothetical protein